MGLKGPLVQHAADHRVLLDDAGGAVRAVRGDLQDGVADAAKVRGQAKEDAGHGKNDSRRVGRCGWEDGWDPTRPGHRCWRDEQQQHPGHREQYAPRDG